MNSLAWLQLTITPCRPHANTSLHPEKQFRKIGICLSSVVLRRELAGGMQATARAPHVGMYVTDLLFHHVLLDIDSF